MKKYLKHVLFVSIFSLSIFWAQLVEAKNRIHIYKESEIRTLYSDAADQILNLIRSKPNAVILVPTGSTPERLYKEIVRRFKQDKSIDLSKARFFNLDEYVGLTKDHPLSYNYYMQAHLYGPLKKIDARRAPQGKNINIPYVEKGETPEKAIARYRRLLSKAGPIDIALVGVGGVAAFKNKSGKTVYKGGHLAFNEHGTPPSKPSHVVTLTEKTKKDTLHRFQSLQTLVKKGVLKPFAHTVPSLALTTGMKEILSAKRIIMMATGESKSIVIRELFKKANNPNLPASYLLTHSNTDWYLDENSGKSQTKEWMTTMTADQLSNKETLRKALIQAAKKVNKPLEAIQLADMTQLGVTEQALNSYRSDTGKTGLVALIQDFKAAVNRGLEELPTGKTILVLSPHPDDDVISMGATLHKLTQKGNKVHVAYAVTGTTAVRDSFESYKKHIKHLESSKLTIEDRVEEAKARVREEEAQLGATRMGVPAQNLHFLRSEFYKRRGIPGLNPITDKDQQAMKTLLETLNPDVIYFAAEDDPHGAHGLTSQLLAQVVGTVDSLKNVKIMGYRGAWEEWPLEYAENLTISTFDAKTMDLKVKSIKDHGSQINAVFPGDDKKEFFERAQDRNSRSGEEVRIVLSEEGKAVENAEVFYQFALDDFIKQYS